MEIFGEFMLNPCYFSLAHEFHFNDTNIYNNYTLLSYLELKFSGVQQTLVVLLNSI